MTLADKTCEACHGGVPKLSLEQIATLSAQIVGWTVDGEKRLLKLVKTKDFQKSLDLANAIGAIAEREQHHPDLLVRWGELKIEIWTHAVDGLTEADFILAAKIDRELASR